jgi:threonine dehydratase
VVRVVVADRPGALASLTATLASLGPQRAVRRAPPLRPGLRVADVEVLLTLETRDPDHREEIVAVIAAAGFAVDLVR